MQQAVPKPQTDNEVPGLKGLPLVGNLPQFQRDPLATLIKASREGGDVTRIDFASQRYYLLSHPDHVRHVLQENNKNYVKGYGKARVLLGNGLALSEGSFWRRQRRLMQPAFHRARLAAVGALTVETRLRHWRVLANKCARFNRPTSAGCDCGAPPRRSM